MQLHYISIHYINLLPINDVPLQFAKYSVVLPQTTDNVRAVTKLLFTHGKEGYETLCPCKFCLFVKRQIHNEQESTPFSLGIGQQMHI
jgi:hypothetical protein